MPSGGVLDITFEVSGQQAIQRKLVTFGARIENMAPAWDEVGTALMLDFMENFSEEGGVFGKGAWAQWQPLARSTVLDRRRLGYPGEHPILVREGDLLASVTIRGAANNVFEVGPNSLTLGTRDRTAKYHQFGTRRMPARKVVGISAQRAGRGGRAGSIVGMLNDYVKRLIAEQGLQP